MRAAVTTKFSLTVSLGGGALFAALVLGRVELVAVAVPLLVAAAAGVAATSSPRLSLELETSEDRCLEGSSIEVAIVVRASSGCEDLEVGLVVPGVFEIAGGAPRAALSLGSGEAHSHTFRLRASRWGAHRLGFVVVRAFGPGRLLGFEDTYDLRRPVRVYPGMQPLRTAVVPPKTQAFAGSYVAATTGSGIEFADVRGFTPGDRFRHINWRISSRRPDIHVNVFHPERNADIVLFLDAFTDVGPRSDSSLDLTVRAASSLARHYLSHRDRVGLVSFGGLLNWLTASMGERQFYRIVEYLLGVQVALSYAWKDIALLPRGTLPPLSLVIALSPLIDERALNALADLRARGFPVLVVDTLREEAVAPAGGIEGQISYRAWRMHRDALRFDLSRSGIPVVGWSGDESLAAVLAEVPELRRYLVAKS